MTTLRRIPVFAILFSLGLFAIASCRTAQQARRSNATHSAANASPATSRQMDSLLLIEAKLTEVIDSLASLVDADHARIRALEQEVQALQGQSYNSQPAMPPNNGSRSNGSYMTAPPPSTPAPYNAPSYTAPSYTPPSYSPPPTTPANPPATPPDNTPVPVPSTQPSDDAQPSFQQKYTAALGLFNDNNFDAALDQFKALERDDPNGVYASNYRYWEAECYYGEKRYNKALETFGTVLEQYPNSTKVAASLFKTGECYERLKDTQSARAAYERVIADYPSSEFRSRALARLKALSH